MYSFYIYTEFRKVVNCLNYNKLHDIQTESKQFRLNLLVVTALWSQSE